MPQVQPTGSLAWPVAHPPSCSFVAAPPGLAGAVGQGTVPGSDGSVGSTGVRCREEGKERSGAWCR